MRCKEHDIDRRDKEWYKKLERVFCDLEKIPYAVIKGEVLSVIAYGDTGWRRCQDIDILIDKKNIAYVDNVFKSAGFEQVVFGEDNKKRELTRKEMIMFANSHQVVPYSKNDIDVDINTSIFWGEYTGSRIDTETVLENRIELKIYNQKLKTLSIPKMFIQVCLHHYKEMNSPYILKIKNTITTAMFQDIYYLFIKLKDELKTLLHYIKLYQVEKYIFYMLYYTNYIFKDPDLQKFVKYCESVDGRALLNQYGLTNAEQKFWKCDFDTRLDNKNVFSLIEKDLSEEDLAKVQLTTGIVEW